MVNKKLLEVLADIKKKNPGLMFKIINENRLLYNNLCRQCQIKLFGMARANPNAAIDLTKVCDKCRPHVKSRLDHINELIAKGAEK